MVGDTVDLDVDETWSELPRLIERVHGVKGVAHVTVNGAPRRSGRPGHGGERLTERVFERGQR